MAVQSAMGNGLPGGESRERSLEIEMAGQRLSYAGEQEMSIYHQAAAKRILARADSLDGNIGGSGIKAPLANWKTYIKARRSFLPVMPIRWQLTSSGDLGGFASWGIQANTLHGNYYTRKRFKAPSRNQIGAQSQTTPMAQITAWFNPATEQDVQPRISGEALPANLINPCDSGPRSLPRNINPSSSRHIPPPLPSSTTSRLRLDRKPAPGTACDTSSQRYCHCPRQYQQPVEEADARRALCGGWR